MEILLVGQSGVDGVGTYINDLAKVMSLNHNVWFYGINPFLKFNAKIKEETSIVPGKYDVAFLNYFKVFPEIDCPKVYHAHLAKFEDGYIQNIESVLKNDTNYKITFNSNFQRQQLIAMDIPNGIMTKLPNYINENVYKVMPSVTKIPGSILLMCGIRENNKPIWKPMLRAMKRLPEYRLDIMGSLSDIVKDDFLEFVDSARNGNINYLGSYVDQVEKVKIINKHELGVGVGRSAKEMILCGLPTLVYREGFAGWLTETNVVQLEKDNFTTRWFEEEDEGGKIGKIVQAIRNPEIYDRAVAATKFGLVANFNKYETLMGI